MLLWALRWELSLFSCFPLLIFWLPRSQQPKGLCELPRGHKAEFLPRPSQLVEEAPPAPGENPPTEEMDVPSLLTEGFGAGDLLLSGVLVNHSLIRLETPTFSPAVSCKMIKSCQNGFCSICHGLDWKVKPSLILTERSSLSPGLAQRHPVCPEGIVSMNCPYEYCPYKLHSAAAVL